MANRPSELAERMSKRRERSDVFIADCDDAGIGETWSDVDATQAAAIR